jgi:hypothetical protein
MNKRQITKKQINTNQQLYRLERKTQATEIIIYATKTKTTPPVNNNAKINIFLPSFFLD